jgi:hypothetical protein
MQKKQPILLNLKKHLKTSAIIAGVFLLIALLLFFALRNTILHKVFEKAEIKLRNSYELKLNIDELKFTELANVQLKQLYVFNAQQDTLVFIQNIKVQPDWLDLLWGEINLNAIEISGMQLHVSQQASSDIQEDTVIQITASHTNSVNGPFALISRLINRAFDAIPNRIQIDRSKILVSTSQFTQELVIQKLELYNHNLQGTGYTFMNQEKQEWLVGGQIDANKKELILNLESANQNRATIPYINQQWNAIVAFNKAQLHIGNFKLRKHEINLHCDMQLENLLIKHSKISSKDVLLPTLDLQLDLKFSKDVFMIDSSSYLKVDSLKVFAFASVTASNTDTILQLKLRIPQSRANQFIAALPEGLFNHIRGMDIAGDFTYSLDFYYNERLPDSTRFETYLKKNNFGIRKYGQANIDKLNQAFTHVVIEQGRAVRSFIVGEENPYYTPLSQIPDKLVKCVLICEDPSFFYHRGFIDEAFKQSIAKNIRTRKFARGASTISMQLIKNVFLTREKTLSRKLEEILLVYIIENNRLVSKERMMEVYLNIIEWGPGVYGIGEASHFYFNKKPNQLTLGECLFLATIIPRPKGFMWRFDTDAKPREFVDRQYKYLTSLMLKRNFITEQDTIGINYQAAITGPAKKLIRKQGQVAPAIQLDENGLPIYEQEDDTESN